MGWSGLFKAELIIENGKVIEIIFKPVKGREPLLPKNLKDFKDFVSVYSEKLFRNGLIILYYTRKFHAKK